MLVILDEPQTTKWGGTAAAPVFRTIAIAAAERLGIQVDNAPTGATVADAATAPGRSAKPTQDAPASFIGLSLRDALERARAAGVTVEVVGSGYVVRQDPPPGRALEAQRPIRLQLDPAGEPLG